MASIMRTVTTVPAGIVTPDDADEELATGAESLASAEADEPETLSTSTTLLTPGSWLAMRSTAPFSRSVFTLPESVTTPSSEVTRMSRVLSTESSKSLD